MDFVVIKVNGKDLSKANHEEAVEAFRTANEPIIVEVLRKSSKTPAMASPRTPTTPETPPSVCDSSTQTEWSGGWETPPLGLISSCGQNIFLHPDDNHQMAMLAPDMMDGPFDSLEQEQEQDDDDDLGCEVEYEEVTLNRSSSSEKLGLTLCYGSPEDPETDIFISEIESESVAARDGRLLEGDQILQINGEEVRNRSEAVKLFSEKRMDFTLFVARPQLQVEDYFLDEQPKEALFGFCSGHKPLLEEQEEEDCTDTGTLENASNHHEKDSGVGRTDESTKNDESSEQEIAENESSSCSPFFGQENRRYVRDGRNFVSLSSKDSVNDCDFVDDGVVAHEESRQFREELERKCASTSTMNLASEILRNGGIVPLCRFQSDASLDREMAMLNQEMENIQLECESLVNRHLQDQQKGKRIVEHTYVNLSEMNNPPRLQEDRCRYWDKRESVEQWVKSMVLGRKSQGHKTKKTVSSREDRDSSSAYNTGESSRSTPLTLELSPVPELDRQGNHRGSMMSLVTPKMEEKGTQLYESDVASVVSCESCRRCCRALMQSEREIRKRAALCGAGSSSKSARKGSSKDSLEAPAPPKPGEELERNKNHGSCYPCTTMYTNEANLQHTIWLQQQLFRQSLLQQQKPSRQKTSLPPHGQSHSRKNSQSHVPIPSGNHLRHPSRNTMLSTVKEEEEELKMEWKVKRRADGSRYIARRPVRNRMLKERAMKIMEERCGLTTDDDAMSELKTGRYWTKEERKRHLERARDRKKREMMMRAKMAALKEHADENEPGESHAKREVNILELSHKKMMRRKGKVFDDFTTVQEVLAHGNKAHSPGSKPQFGILSVTTV